MTKLRKTYSPPIPLSYVVTADGTVADVFVVKSQPRFTFQPLAFALLLELRNRWDAIDFAESSPELAFNTARRNNAYALEHLVRTLSHI